MAKKSIGDINGWVFIGVGFVVMTVSIFFYDTLKIFIVIGGLMTLYGLGKLSYDNLKAKIFPKEEEGPINLNKVENPYLQRAAHPQRTEQRVAPQQIQYRAAAPMQQRVQHHSQQQTQYAQQRAAHPQGRYCHGCGAPKQPHHRFCAHCGTRFA